MIGDWGFTIDAGSRAVIMSIFIAYSLVIVVFGFLVKRQTKGLSSADKLTAFLTGGKGISAFGIAMVSLTSSFSIGVMIGNVGRVYALGGLIAAICFLTNSWGVFQMQATLGKKLSILKQRTGVESIIGALRHRFNSKFLAGFLAVTMTAFLLSNMSSQFNGGARMIAVMTGVPNYWFGIMLLGVVTIVYASVGVVRSMIRVAMLQGVFMLVASISTFSFGAAAVANQYGSWADAVSHMLVERDFLFNPRNFTYFEAIGLCILVGFVITACIHALPSTFAHQSSKTIKNGIIIATVSVPFINGLMPSVGFFAYLLNPNLASGDLATPFVAGYIAPSLIGGLVLAGSASALQSSVAAFMLVAATCIIKDLYKGIIRPDATDEKVLKLMPVFSTIAGVIGISLALYPMPLMIIVNLFSNGGMLTGLWAPLVLGLHWKKATPAGAVSSSIVGLATFIVTFVLSTNAATRADWNAFARGVNPAMIGLIVAIIVMVVVSQFTKKVELGVAQVWFGKTYDEKYTKFLS